MRLSFFLQIFALIALSALSQTINADGSYGEKQDDRRNTCTDLVKPKQSGSGSGSKEHTTSAPSSEKTGCASSSSDSSVTVVVVDSGSTGAPVELSTDGAVTESSSVGTGCSGESTSGETEATDSASTDSGLVECQLTDYLYELCASLSGEEYELFYQFIISIQIDILADSSLTLEQMVVQCGFAIEAFFEVNVDIEAKFQFQMLGSWGYLKDFIYVGYQISFELTSNITELDSEGNCALFESLRNATKGTDMESACEELIAQLTVVLGYSGWSEVQINSEIYSILVAFFAKYPSYKSFFMGIEIEGFGSFSYFFKSFSISAQMTSLDDAIGGDADNCALLDALYEGYMNVNLSISVRNQLKQLYNKTYWYFESDTTIEGRLDYFVEICYELSILSPYIEQIFMSLEIGEWGSIYDLIFIHGLCKGGDQCGDLNNGSGSHESSQEATTTMKPADCSTRYSLIESFMYNATYETSYFMIAVNDAYATWNSTTKSGFNTYKNKFQATTVNSTATKQEKWDSMYSIAASYNSNNAWKQQILYNVTISQWGGTIGQFMACGSDCGCP